MTPLTGGVALHNPEPGRGSGNGEPAFFPRFCESISSPEGTPWVSLVEPLAAETGCGAGFGCASASTCAGNRADAEAAGREWETCSGFVASFVVKVRAAVGTALDSAGAIGFGGADAGAVFDAANAGAGAAFDANAGAGAVFDAANAGTGAMFDAANAADGAAVESVAGAAAPRFTVAPGRRATTTAIAAAGTSSVSATTARRPRRAGSSDRSPGSTGGGVSG